MKVKQMGPRKRAQQPDGGDIQAPKPRVQINSTQRAGGVREVAPRIFDVPATRGEVVDAASSDISEIAGEGPVLPGDHQEGGPLILESNRVLTKGGAVKASRAAAQAPAGGARRMGPPRAAWMGAGSGPQDQVVVTAETRQEGTVSEDQIVHRSEPGPQTPTGEPCTCVYEWETNEAENTIEVFIKPSPGISTKLRGGPVWMTWCVVCGGERDGNFRPENAIRYGNAIPEAAPQVDANEIAQQVLDGVMGQLGDYLGSEGFINAIADRVRQVPPPIPK
jgi:hypothetical protein